MKLTITLFLLVLLSTIVFSACPTNLDQNTSFSEYGQCFVEYGTYGSTDLMALIIVFAFVALIIIVGVPAGVSLPLGTIAIYALYLMSGSGTLFFIFILGLIISGLLIGKTIIKNISRTGF